MGGHVADGKARLHARGSELIGRLGGEFSLVADLHFPGQDLLRFRQIHLRLGQDLFRVRHSLLLLTQLLFQFRLPVADVGGQRRGVDHQAVADHRFFARAQNPAGDQLQNELFLADKDSVAGVVSALVARHHVEPLGEKIDDFTFTLVSPLRAQDDDVSHF